MSEMVSVKKRSTVDHISSQTNIIDTQKKKQSTFCAFIDFQKAFDSVNRPILWRKLNEIGMSTKMLSAVRSLYKDILTCVRVNDICTCWFSVITGERQVCSLSTILFSIFINDLAVMLKELHKGVKIDNERVCILLYADDIVLIAENESDLQDMLTMLSTWCIKNGMCINASKSNVVHFRPNSSPRSNYVFNCGDCKIEYVSKYMYLGLTLTEHQDYNITVKLVAQCAGRALGLLYCKVQLFRWSTL